MATVSTKTKLTDDQRGQLTLSAACYGLMWSASLGIINLLVSVFWYPETITRALWYFPVIFIAVFLWKRYWLLEQANEIIARTNKRIQEEIDRA